MEQLLIALGAIMLVILMALLFSLPTMWLWNWLMPTIFGLTKIGFSQALGINILCGLLFKSYSSNNSKINF